ncbi:MAG: hypothetical protein ACKV2V_23670 [Blastocatellia bacterium]
MQQIEISQLPPELHAVLDMMSRGEEIIVSDNQRPVARISKFRDNLPEQRESCGDAMAGILEQLAKRQSLAGIEDPVAWEREVREDRLLPGRD